MRTARVCILFLAAVCVVAAAARPAAAAGKEFPLQEGDVWVMAGDSITAQHLHTNYFEAFCYARYPKLSFRFRNSGVGGDTIPKVLARFDYDVAAWKPTVVSVELGMNDKNGFTTEQYIANMAKLTQEIQNVKARPVFFTASPINNGETMAKLNGNARLDEYAVALKKFAAEQKAPFADQFHDLIDVWGKNKPYELLANTLPNLKMLAQDDKLAGVENLRKFLDEQAKNPTPPVTMKGDAVHPGEPGQLMMAATLLKDLGARDFVSSLEVDAAGVGEGKNSEQAYKTQGCQVSGLRMDGGKLVFDRVDECLPFPIADEARPVLALDPTVLGLSQYTLKVKGLKEGTYNLAVNGNDVTALSNKDLDKGVNLTAYAQGPIAGQGKEILAAVNAKEGMVGQWRNMSKAASAPGAGNEAKEKLAEATKKVEEADGKIHEAAQPRKLHFELALAK
jgi:lysophospholipase L1-like esterase